MIKKLLILTLLTSVVFGAYRVPTKFTTAKTYAERMILSEMDNYTIKTFYSGIIIKQDLIVYIPAFPEKPIVEIQLVPSVDNYTATTYEKRSHTIEWEHVVPASWFVTADPFIKEVWDNGHDKCVTSSGSVYKGRRCAQRVSPLFNKMEADLYNLEPALGSLNAIRSDNAYGIIDGEARDYGQLIDFEINRSKNIVEPMESIRGKIGRIFIYMNWKYGVTYPDHENTMIMMKEWAEKYPMDTWEKRKRELLNKTYGITFE